MINNKSERRKVVTVKDARAEISGVMSNLLLLALVGLTGYTTLNIDKIKDNVSSIDTASQLTKQRQDLHETADREKFARINDQLRLILRK